ncbi:MAG: hypothetical protein AB8B39_01810, partial [Prochlorococcus sp.]
KNIDSFSEKNFLLFKRITSYKIMLHLVVAKVTTLALGVLRHCNSGLTATSSMVGNPLDYPYAAGEGILENIHSSGLPALKLG